MSHQMRSFLCRKLAQPLIQRLTGFLRFHAVWAPVLVLIDAKVRLWASAVSGVKSEYGACTSVVHFLNS